MTKRRKRARDLFVRLAGVDSTSCTPTNCSLAGVGHRALMEIDITGEVEDPFDWRRDPAFEVDLDHVSTCFRLNPQSIRNMLPRHSMTAHVRNEPAWQGGVT